MSPDPTPGVQVGFGSKRKKSVTDGLPSAIKPLFMKSMMGGHQGYDFGLDPNQKGGKRKKRVLSAAVQQSNLPANNYVC